MILLYCTSKMRVQRDPTSIVWIDVCWEYDCCLQSIYIKFISNLVFYVSNVILKSRKIERELIFAQLLFQN